jgi:hypothetical protein
VFPACQRTLSWIHDTEVTLHQAFVLIGHELIGLRRAPPRATHHAALAVPV